MSPAVPLTLADYAAEPKELLAGIAKILRKNSKFMDILQFVDVGALSVKVLREGKMPDVSWRNAGEPHTGVKATKPDEVTENAFSIGNAITVDKVYMKDKSARLYNPMTYNTDLVVRSIGRNFNDKCINGLPEDMKNPVGLWWRVKNKLAASQNILAKSGGLDISPDATGLTANGQAYIDKLDELLYAVTDNFDGGNGVYILTNDTLIQRTNSIFRQSGQTDSTKDTLGRVFLTYKGAQFIDMGMKYDDITRVMGDVEALDGSALTGGTGTAAYAVKIGKEDFTAWQEYALDVSEPKIMDDQVTYQSVVDWVVGLAISNPRSVARLFGVVAK
ncbi:MAG: hypothetical protein WAW52_01750 [Methanothrix sp.]